MLDFIFTCFLIASISWLYNTVLKDYLLSDWFLFGYKHFGRHETILWKQLVYKPIWGCELCFSGQFALWMFLHYEAYSPFYHLGFVALSILFTKLIYAATNNN